MFAFLRPKEAAVAAPPRALLELDDDECLDALLQLLGKLALRQKQLQRPPPVGRQR
jgi:hypothetical protein